MQSISENDLINFPGVQVEPVWGSHNAGELWLSSSLTDVSVAAPSFGAVLPLVCGVDWQEQTSSVRASAIRIIRLVSNAYSLHETRARL